MTELQNLSVEQLRKVVSIKEQIESLEAQLTAIIGDGTPASIKVPRKRTMSAAAKAGIAAAQRTRWAKVRAANAGATESEPTPKKRRKMSAAGRAKIAAAARARWAKAKAAGKTSL